MLAKIYFLMKKLLHKFWLMFVRSAFLLEGLIEKLKLSLMSFRKLFLYFSFLIFVALKVTEQRDWERLRYRQPWAGSWWHQNIRQYCKLSSQQAGRAAQGGGEVKAKKQPKSRIGNAIAPPPKSAASTALSSPTEPSSANTSGMPTATSTSTSQADFERLKPQG